MLRLSRAINCLLRILYSQGVPISEYPNRSTTDEIDSSDRAAIVREIDETAADAYIAETFEEAMNNLTEYARQMIGAHQSTLSYLPNGDFHDAVHSHSFSKNYEKYNTYDVKPTDEGIWGVIVEQKIPMRMTHEALLAHPRWIGFSALKEERDLEHPPKHNWLAVPILRRNGELIGVIQLSDKYVGDFTEQNQIQVTRLANVISPIFDLQYFNNREAKQPGFENKIASTATKSRLHDEIREAHDALEQQIKEAREGVRERTIIAEIGRIISSSLDIEQVYEQFAQQVRLLIPFDRISINIFDIDSYTFQTTYNMGLDVPERIKNVTLPLGESVSAQVIRTRSEILIEAEEESEISERYATLLPSFRAGLRTFLTIPLIYKDKVVGALHLRSCTPKAYLDYHRDLAGQIGIQIAGAIASAQLHEVVKQSHEELKRHGEELARSNADLEQFAYVASHDLQTPLRAVSGLTSILADDYKGKLDDDADELIAMIITEVGRMQALINDLLAYSRVGRNVDELKPTDCETIMAEELNELRVLIEETGAVITHDPLPIVTGHHSLLSQLFRNLLGNALKYRSEEPPLIHVSVERSDSEWTFSVSDNGIGIEPQYAERIFLMFQRLHTPDQYSGSGIGLAICKKTVTHLGGRIWLDSQPSKGTTFRFTVPISSEETVNSS